MNVIAVRDDGALLVSEVTSPDPLATAVIVSDDGVWATSQGSAFARGAWKEPHGETVPTEVEDQVTTLLKTQDDLTAAAEVHTGAMIALIPTDADAARLAVDGGEPPEQLHVTLYYLGEAADFTDESVTHLIELVREYVADLSVVNGDGFAIAVFNPAGSTQSDDKEREPCVVLEVSGEELGRAHNLVCAAIEDYGADLPVQHKPWIPHITLAYAEDTDLEPYVEKIGPVKFDRVRLAFGGENYDIPLGEAPELNETLTLAEINLTCAVLGISLTDFYTFHTFSAFDREKDVNLPGGVGHNLRDYWTKGPGAAKIGWGTAGDFNRCVLQLGKYVKDPQGLCAEYHKRATGEWPGRGRHHVGETLVFEYDPSQPRDYHGRWRDANSGDSGDLDDVGQLADKIWGARHVRNGQTILSGVDGFGGKHDLVSNGDGSVSVYDDYTDDAHFTFDDMDDLRNWLKSVEERKNERTVIKWREFVTPEGVTPAPKSTSAPALVPTPVKVPSAPDVDSIPALKKSLDQLKKITSSEHVSSDDLSTGEVGEVEKIKTKDGVYVSKTNKDWGSLKAKDLTDAEDLVAELGFRIGARVAAVDRVNEHTVNMEFIRGLPAGEIAAFNGTIDTQAIKSHPSSRMLGLLDLITLNQDRHDYNWMVNEDDDPPTAIGIDHGLAWGSAKPDVAGLPNDTAIHSMIQNVDSPFVDELRPYDELFRRKDIDRARSALDAMESRFNEMGKQRWLMISRRVLDLIEEQMDDTLGQQA